jgi:hypothetical protein
VRRRRVEHAETSDAACCRCKFSSERLAPSAVSSAKKLTAFEVGAGRNELQPANSSQACESVRVAADSPGETPKYPPVTVSEHYLGKLTRAGHSKVDAEAANALTH